MSATLWIINWAPEEVTPSLNTEDLSPVKATEAKYNYFPISTSVPRDASAPGEPGIWGNNNSLTVKPTGGGSSQIYNNLQDPEGAAPNTDLLLWIFPDFLVFSQLDKQLGNPVKPT